MEYIRSKNKNRKVNERATALLQVRNGDVGIRSTRQNGHVQPYFWGRTEGLSETLVSRKQGQKENQEKLGIMPKYLDTLEGSL